MDETLFGFYACVVALGIIAAIPTKKIKKQKLCKSASKTKIESDIVSDIIKDTFYVVNGKAYIHQTSSCYVVFQYDSDVNMLEDYNILKQRYKCFFDLEDMRLTISNVSVMLAIKK